MIAPALTWPARFATETPAEELERWRREGVLRLHNEWMDVELGYALVEDLRPGAFDVEAARAAGFADVTAPYTGVLSWTLPAAWLPGETLFDRADRDAQPVRSGINSAELPLGPKTTGFFCTDI